jgi:hypothetical protein
MNSKIITIERARVYRIRLLSDPLYFTVECFREVFNKEFLINDHHHILANTCKDIYSGKLKRVLIEMPPRYSKTEMMVKMFCALGFAINPQSAFLHISYSDSLALDNSNTVRDIVKSEFFQSFFPMSVRKDTDSKKRWNTEFGGTMYATSSGGQITGFGAGQMTDEEEEERIFTDLIGRLAAQSKFSGAIVIDDALKVDDAYSMIKRDRVNSRFDGTVRSRVNSRLIPIFVIGQRLHDNDLIGYLLRKEPGEWTRITIPALSYDQVEKKWIALWPLKQTVDDLFKLQRINKQVFQTQYQQETSGIKVGGEFWTSFDAELHVKKLKFDPAKTIHIVVDNNVQPYIAISIWQFEDKRSLEGLCFIRQIHEIAASDPDNSATRSATLLVNWLKMSKYGDVVYIYADQTTTAQNTIDDDKKSFLDKFCTEVEKSFVIVKRIPSSNPPVAITGEFVNAIYSDNFDDLCIEINETCQISIKDYQQTKKDVEGKILKKRVTNSATGISYEEFGHFSDIKRYIIYMAFNEEFHNFKARILNDKPYVIGGGITDRKI